MSHILNNPDAYVVSPRFAAQQRCENTRDAAGRKLMERQALHDEAWLCAKMQEFAADNGLADTTVLPAAPTQKPASDQDKAIEQTIALSTMADEQATANDLPLSDSHNRRNGCYRNAPAGTKRCSMCGEYLPFNRFYRRSTTRDGLSYRCKICSAAYQRECRKRQKDIKQQDAILKSYRPGTAILWRDTDSDYYRLGYIREIIHTDSTTLYAVSANPDSGNVTYITRFTTFTRFKPHKQ